MGVGRAYHIFCAIGALIVCVAAPPSEARGSGANRSAKSTRRAAQGVDAPVALQPFSPKDLEWSCEVLSVEQPHCDAVLQLSADRRIASPERLEIAVAYGPDLVARPGRLVLEVDGVPAGAQALGEAPNEQQTLRWSLPPDGLRDGRAHLVLRWEPRGARAGCGPADPRAVRIVGLPVLWGPAPAEAGSLGGGLAAMANASEIAVLTAASRSDSQWESMLRMAALVGRTQGMSAPRWANITANEVPTAPPRMALIVGTVDALELPAAWWPRLEWPPQLAPGEGIARWVPPEADGQPALALVVGADDDGVARAVQAWAGQAGEAVVRVGPEAQVPANNQVLPFAEDRTLFAQLGWSGISHRGGGSAVRRLPLVPPQLDRLQVGDMLVLHSAVAGVPNGHSTLVLRLGAVELHRAVHRFGGPEHVYREIILTEDAIAQLYPHADGGAKPVWLDVELTHALTTSASAGICDSKAQRALTTVHNDSYWQRSRSKLTSVGLRELPAAVRRNHGALHLRALDAPPDKDVADALAAAFWLGARAPNKASTLHFVSGQPRPEDQGKMLLWVAASLPSGLGAQWWPETPAQGPGSLSVSPDHPGAWLAADWAGAARALATLEGESVATSDSPPEPVAAASATAASDQLAAIRGSEAIVVVLVMALLGLWYLGSTRGRRRNEERIAAREATLARLAANGESGADLADQLEPDWRPNGSPAENPSAPPKTPAADLH